MRWLGVLGLQRRGVSGCHRNVPNVPTQVPSWECLGWRVAQLSEGEARDQPEGRRAAGEQGAWLCTIYSCSIYLHTDTLCGSNRHSHQALPGVGKAGWPAWSPTQPAWNPKLEANLDEVLHIFMLMTFNWHYFFPTLNVFNHTLMTEFGTRPYITPPIFPVLW